MTDELEKWQAAYQKATPKLDIEALQAEVVKSRNKEKFKGYLELVLSIAVSAFCIYASLVFASNPMEQILFVALSPIPIIFSIWIVWQQHKSHAQNSLSVDALIHEKQAKLHRQLAYWQASTLIFALLWSSILGITLWSYITDAESFVRWLTICLIQAPLLIFTIARWHYLKKQLPTKLAKIEEFKDSN